MLAQFEQFNISQRYQLIIRRKASMFWANSISINNLTKCFNNKKMCFFFISRLCLYQWYLNIPNGNLATRCPLPHQLSPLPHPSTRVVASATTAMRTSSSSSAQTRTAVRIILWPWSLIRTLHRPLLRQLTHSLRKSPPGKRLWRKIRYKTIFKRFPISYLMLNP